MAFEEVLIVNTPFNVLQHLWRINAYSGCPYGRIFLILKDLPILIAPFYNISNKEFKMKRTYVWISESFCVDVQETIMTGDWDFNSQKMIKGEDP